MNTLDEQSALAIIFANTKRKKRTEDLVTIAQACEYLVRLYGTQQALARKVGLSAEIIREFRKILTLPERVRDMIRTRQIDSLDVAYRISMLGDANEQVKAAKEITVLSSEDVRDIKRLVRTAQLSAAESKKRVLESKLKGLHVFIMDFDDEQYRRIIARAKQARTDPAELVKQVVLQWLEHSTPRRIKRR